MMECKVLAPLLTAKPIGRSMGGDSQRRCAQTLSIEKNVKRKRLPARKGMSFVHLIFGHTFA